jgi:heme/copper-type cytochrome/quinol oxidase subunit 3
MSAVPVPRRASFSAAWWGIAMVIASEGMLFGAFIATYFYLRFKAPLWPPHGDHAPPIATTLILTACLVATSAPMAIASWATAAGQLARARIALIVALVVQCGYVAYEIDDFRSQLHVSDITHDQYTSIYYTLLGADHAHVLFGVLLTAWLIAKLTTGITRYRMRAAQAIAWYWHFVNVMTLVVIGTLLSAHA